MADHILDHVLIHVTLSCTLQLLALTGAYMSLVRTALPAWLAQAAPMMQQQQQHHWQQDW